MLEFEQIFGWLFVSFGTYQIIWCVGMLWKGSNSRDWPCVEGEVLSSKIDRRSESGDGFGVEYILRITYSYRVGPEEFKNSNGRYSLVEEWGARNKVLRLQRQFGHEKIRVYYDPNRPSTSVLERGLHWSYWFMIPFCMILVVIGCVMTEIWR